MSFSKCLIYFSQIEMLGFNPQEQVLALHIFLTFFRKVAYDIDFNFHLYDNSKVFIIYIHNLY